MSDQSRPGRTRTVTETPSTNHPTSVVGDRRTDDDRDREQLHNCVGINVASVRVRQTQLLFVLSLPLTLCLHRSSVPRTWPELNMIAVIKLSASPPLVNEVCRAIVFNMMCDHCADEQAR